MLFSDVFVGISGQVINRASLGLIVTLVVVVVVLFGEFFHQSIACNKIPI